LSSLLVFNRVHTLEIQSVMLVLLAQLCELLPLYSNLLGRGWGVLSCVGDHILQEVNTLILTRIRT